MKKTLYLLGIVLFSMTFSLSMTSCNSSDDETTEVVTNSKLVGKWFFESSDFHPENEFITEEYATTAIPWIYFTELGDVSWYDSDLQEVIYADYILDGTILSIFNIEHDDYLPYTYTVKKLTDTEMTLQIEMEGLFTMDVHYKKNNP